MQHSVQNFKKYLIYLLKKHLLNNSWIIYWIYRWVLFIYSNNKKSHLLFYILFMSF